MKLFCSRCLYKAVREGAVQLQKGDWIHPAWPTPPPNSTIAIIKTGVTKHFETVTNLNNHKRGLRIQ